MRSWVSWVIYCYILWDWECLFLFSVCNKSWIFHWEAINKLVGLREMSDFFCIKYNFYLKRITRYMGVWYNCMTRNLPSWLWYHGYQHLTHLPRLTRDYNSQSVLRRIFVWRKMSIEDVEQRAYPAIPDMYCVFTPHLILHDWFEYNSFPLAKAD